MIRSIRFGPWLVAMLAAAPACGRETPVAKARAETAPPARHATDTAHRPVHVDSILPREVALERFQRASTRVSALSSGARTRDDLVRRFARAVEARDTAALRRLVLSRGEYAFLYYPTSAQGLPPYSLPPELLWLMMVEQSNRGVTRLLAERAGRPLGVAGLRCVGDSTLEGKNRLWGPCLIRRVEAPGDTVEERLFGPIIERDGRFKFVSYSNKL